jgi:hypothetical protein
VSGGELGDKQRTIAIEAIAASGLSDLAQTVLSVCHDKFTSVAGAAALSLLTTSGTDEAVRGLELLRTLVDQMMESAAKALALDVERERLARS